MNTSRTTLSLMFLYISLVLVSQRSVRADQGPELCKVESLPSDIQDQLKQRYGSWRIQDPGNLSRRAHDRWGSEKPVTCPGIAVGHFESARTTTYAILLVPTGHADEKYRLVVFSQKGGQHAYGLQVVDKLDQRGAANYFIHPVAIGKVFSESSKRKFQADADDGILLVDSAENEYGVEIYFWSSGRYRHEPIDY